MTDRVDTKSADWKDGYETGFAEGASGKFNPDGSYAIPNSAAEPQVTRGRDESLIPNLDSWDDLDADVTPNSVTITVSREAADWITAKAMEHGCTEDEVIATLIADWNEATDG